MTHSFGNASSPTSILSADGCYLSVAHGIALIITNAFVCVFGTPGNLLVCVAIVTNPCLRRSSYYLLFSLAIADLIVTIICEPLDIAVLSKRTFFNDCAPSLERPYKILFIFSCAASVLHLTSISVDRLLAILFPLRQKEIMKKMRIEGYADSVMGIPDFSSYFSRRPWQGRHASPHIRH